MKAGDMAKILIVDDEERFLRIYSAILMSEGYEVLTASSAKKALDLSNSAQPNLILLDVMMPSVDGVEACGSLSENASTRHIPVIFLTSLIKEEEEEDARGKIGGRVYISKSTPREKFVARVKNALSSG
jgi:CheY-like chemotaxis protein